MVRGLACNPHCTQLQYNLYYRCGQQGGQLCDQCTLLLQSGVLPAATVLSVLQQFEFQNFLNNQNQNIVRFFHMVLGMC